MAKKKKKGLSGGAKAGIVLVILLAAAALTLGLISYFQPSLTIQLKEEAERNLHKPQSVTESLGEGDTWTLSEEEMLALSNVTFDQSMLLVNGSHKLPADFRADVAEYKTSTVFMNRCIMDSYARLAARIRQDFDEPLYVSSAYRTREEQEEILRESPDVAQEVDASEHQCGLALDVYVPQYAGAGFLRHDAGKFVNEKAWEFGFIIRYPSYGEKETGISFEPWHVRYVGAPHAQYMMENKVTLEAYMEMLPSDTFLKVGHYLVTRQSGDTYTLPKTWESAVISPDNCGGYVMTFYMG